MNKTLAIAALLAVAATGCGTPGVPDAVWHDMDPAGWPYDNVIEFAGPADSAAFDSVAITVRHSSAYAYSNLWLEVAYATADTTAADTFNIMLADPFGHWFGKGSGLSFQRTDTLALSHTPNPGTAVKVRHVMRVDTLRDIEQLGLSPIHH